MILSPGQSFGAYKIIAPLGRGGMGEVYRARDSRLGREVALKVLREDGAADPDRLRRFEQEARAASSLNHPNIVVVYEVGDATLPGLTLPTRYLAMEFLDGRPLNMVLSREPLSARRFLDLATQLADGIARAHEGGIVHRDLKPSNVIVTSEGHLKILDFGLAKLRPALGDHTDTHLTAEETKTVPGTILGTVAYMSPEQARGETATSASDQFSLGCMFYEMLTGRRPFAGKSSADTVSAILRDDPSPILDANANVPPPLCWIVDRCLAKAPEDRYVSTRDLAKDLHAFRGHSAEATGRTAAVASRVRKRRRLLAIAGAAALLLLGGAVALITQSWKPRPEVEFRRLTFRKGVVWRALFVPNSDNILYTASWDGLPTKTYLTIPESEGNDRSLESEEQLPMAYTSDGAQVLVLLGRSRAAINSKGTLAWWPALGGKPRPILQNAGWADWAEASRLLAVVDDAGAERRLDIRQADGSHVRTIFQTTGAISYVRFSPDRKAVAFIHHPTRGDDGGEIRLAFIDGTRSVALTPHFERCVGLAWNKRTGEILFTASRANPSNSVLWKVSPSGRWSRVQSLPDFYVLQDVSDSGRRCLLASAAGGTALVVRRSGSPPKDLSWLGTSHISDVSPDGKEALFSDSGATEKTVGTWIRPIDGGEAVRLSSATQGKFSPDGRWVIALTPPLAGPRQLLLVPVGDGVARQLTFSTAEHGYPAFVDANKLLFVRYESGTSQVWSMATDGTGARPLGAEGCDAPTADPSAREYLCVCGPARNTLFRFPMPEKGAGRKLHEIPVGEIFIYARWNPSGSQVFAVTQYRRLLTIDAASGRAVSEETVSLGEAIGSESLLAAAFSPDATVQAYSFDRFSSGLYLADGL